MLMDLLSNESSDRTMAAPVLVLAGAMVVCMMSLKRVVQLDEGVRMVAKIHARKQPHMEASTWCSRVARTIILQWRVPSQCFLSFEFFEVM